MGAHADATVVFNTRIDESGAQKDLNKIERDIEKTKGKLKEQTGKQSGLKADLDAAKKAAEETEATIHRLKKELTEAQEVTDWRSDSGPMETSFEDFYASQQKQKEIPKQLKKQEELLAKQAAEVKRLEKDYKDISDDVTNTTAALAQAETRAGQLAQKITKAGKSSEKMAKATKKARKQMDAFGKRIAAVVRSALIFTVITQALAKFRDWLGRVVKTSDEASSAMAKLKGALLTMVQPLVEVIIPAFTFLVNVATKVIMALARLFAWLSGSSVKANAKAAESLYNEAEALENVGSAAKDAQKQLAGFDEINKLSDTSQSGGGNSDTIAPDFNFSEADSFGDKFLEIFSVFEPFVARVKEFLVELITFDFSPLGEGLSMMLTGLLTGDFPMFVEGFKLLLNTLVEYILHVAVSVLEFLRDIWHMGVDWVQTLINSFLDWLDEITGGQLHNTIEAVRLLFNNLVEDAKLIFDGLIDFLVGVFTGDWEKAWEGVKKIFSGIFNAIGDIVVGVVNTAIGIIKDLIGWIKEAVSQLKEMWTNRKPGSGSGGIGGWGSFATITASSVPALAQGAVIPANREFLAVLGDQKSGTNIEAPLSTIEQALENVMRRRGGAGGGPITIILELNKREFGRAVYECGNEETQRVGLSLTGG